MQVTKRMQEIKRQLDELEEERRLLMRKHRAELVNTILDMINDLNAGNEGDKFSLKCGVYKAARLSNL